MTRAREALGLDVGDVAALLGVATSTVYRWEADDGRRLDPRSRALLDVLEEVARQPDARDTGAALRRELRMRGPLAALYALLGRVYGQG